MVNAVMAGETKTDMFNGYVASLPEGSEKRKAAEARTVAEPEDIADIVTFLASDKSRWVQGSTVSANRGMIFF